MSSSINFKKSERKKMAARTITTIFHYLFQTKMKESVVYFKYSKCLW